MKKKIFGFIIMVMLMFTAGLNVTAVEDKNTLVVALGAEPKSMDPIASNDIPSHRVYLHIYDTLLGRDTDGNIIPGLADSWKQKDSKTLVLYLKKGVKFHDGGEFTAEDVVFTLNRNKNSSDIISYFKEIDKVEAVDKYTVKITTVEPFAPLLGYLAHTSSSIVSKNSVTENGGCENNPIGTGPYRFVEWKHGDRIVLKRNPDYYGEKPATENIVFRMITEGVNRAIALETGEVDIAFDIDPINIQFIKDNPDLVIMERSAISINYLGFNTEKTPFNKKEVRQAIAYAIDAEGIVNAVYLGGAKTGDSPLPPGVMGHIDTGKNYNFDLKKAKELMVQAGYPKGFKARLVFNNKNIENDVGVIIRDQLKQIGIDVEIQVVDWRKYLDILKEGKEDMFILSWVALPEPDACLYPLFHSSTIGSAGNRTFYRNERVDELLDSARNTTVYSDREKYYSEIQEILQEELPLYVLCYPFKNAGLQKNIKNFHLDMENKHRLNRVIKE